MGRPRGREDCAGCRRVPVLMNVSPPTVSDDVGPMRAGRSLTERMRQLSPHEAIGFLPYTTGVAGLLSVGLVSIKLWREPAYPYLTTVVGLAGLSLVSALEL